MDITAKILCPSENRSDRFLIRTFIVSIPLGTIFAGLGGVLIAEKSISGYAWVAQLTFAMSAFIFCRRRILLLPFLAFIPWVLWILARCDWNDSISVQRTIMILCPVLIGTAAANILGSSIYIQWLLEAFKPTVIILFLMSMTQNMLGTLPMGLRFQSEGSGMTLVLAATYFAIYVILKNRMGILMFAICLGICVLHSLRGDTLACILALLFCPVAYKASRRLKIAFICLICGILILCLPSMRQKMINTDVYEPGRMITLDDVNTSGRLYAWELYLEEANKNPVWGSGGNASGEFGKYNIMDETQWHHPHNEYIRVYFDYGVIGLILLGLPVIGLIFGVCRQFRRQQNLTLKKALAVSFSGLILACILCFTDNVLLDVQFYGNWLFCLIGASYGCSLEMFSCPVYEKQLLKKYPHVFHEISSKTICNASVSTTKYQKSLS